VVAAAWGADLALFLGELAAEYRGWDAERSWCTDDGDFAVSALFRSGGYAGLTWTVRAGRGWSASVTTWVEGGERLAGLAAESARFLAPGGREDQQAGRGSDERSVG